MDTENNNKRLEALVVHAFTTRASVDEERRSRRAFLQDGRGAAIGGWEGMPGTLKTVEDLAGPGRTSVGSVPNLRGAAVATVASLA